MALFSTSNAWGAPQRLIHWAMAALILFMLGLGFWMTSGVDDLLRRFELTQTHKSWGFVVFTLAILRIIWRLVDRTTPNLPSHMSRPHRFAARAAHLGLYALMLVMPISGWLMASASPLQDVFGIQNRVFDLFNLYDPFIPGNQELTDLFASVHFYAAVALGFLLIGRAGAAIWHHIHHKDGILMRMIRG